MRAHIGHGAFHLVFEDFDRLGRAILAAGGGAIKRRAAGERFAQSFAMATAQSALSWMLRTATTEAKLAPSAMVFREL